MQDFLSSRFFEGESVVESLLTANKVELIKCLQQMLPPGSPEPQDSTIIALVKTLTTAIIQAYKSEGKLQDDPLAESRERKIYLYETEVRNQLKGKVVLITGGEGCVGSNLLNKVKELGAQRVVSVDNARCHDSTPSTLIDERAVFYAADIRDYETLKGIFEAEKPAIVFHLAAQRLPGLAEIKIRDTITTNIFGTQNVIEMCEMFGVEQCIFSSTGKASRYFTTEVYAASKKVAEWLFARATQEGKVIYGAVRFTHIVENSIVSEEIDEKIKRGIVSFHAPNRFILGQNISEAVHLLLNAVVLSYPSHLKLLAVRNLGWPIDTLEIALFKIVRSGKSIPLYFKGLPPGYDEPFFYGQFNPSSRTEVNPLINALEDLFRTSDLSGDMVVTQVSPFASSTLINQLSVLQILAADPDFPEAQLKKALARTVKEVTRSIFVQAPPEQVLQILKWGVNPKRLKFEGISIEAHREIAGLLVQSLYGRLNQTNLEGVEKIRPWLDELVEVLAGLPGSDEEVAYLRAVSRNLLHSRMASGVELVGVGANTNGRLLG